VLVVVTLNTVVRLRALFSDDEVRTGDQFRGAVIDISKDSLDVAVKEHKKMLNNTN